MLGRDRCFGSCDRAIGQCKLWTQNERCLTQNEITPIIKAERGCSQVPLSFLLQLLLEVIGTSLEHERGNKEGKRGKGEPSKGAGLTPNYKLGRGHCAFRSTPFTKGRYVMTQTSLLAFPSFGLETTFISKPNSWLPSFEARTLSSRTLHGHVSDYPMEHRPSNSSLPQERGRCLAIAPNALHQRSQNSPNELAFFGGCPFRLVYKETEVKPPFWGGCYFSKPHHPILKS